MSTATVRKVGAQVRGRYMGHDITGTVRSVRAHTLNWDCTEVIVDLHVPVAICGHERTSLLFSVNHDGTECTSYTGGDGTEGLTLI